MKFTVETLIALVALLFSVVFGIHSMYTARRQTRLQERLAEHELRTHQEALDHSQRADLQVRLERDPDRIVLMNCGGAAARDVHLDVKSANTAPNPIGPHDVRRLPLARLGPDDECPFSAFVLWDYNPAFEIVIQWRDPDGTERRTERTLYG